MVRNKFAYLINSYVYYLYDQLWSVDISMGRRTSTRVSKGGELNATSAG